MLSRKGIPQGEWKLQLESVRMIWIRYGTGEVDLLATSENTNCRLFFSMSHSPLKGYVLTLMISFGIPTREIKQNSVSATLLAEILWGATVSAYRVA